MSVSINNLSKHYGSQKAVDQISFSAQNGEVLGFLGPNGAGKTTTMKIVSCFIPATSGEVTVCGMDVRKNALDVRKKIGYLPEHNPLYNDMYIREYLMFIAGLHKLGKQSKSRVDAMINQCGLTLESKKKIGQLSKGFRQRVGLAQAMIHEPEVLILDEPTSGLDPNQLIEIRELIITLGKRKTVILSTHIMQEVQAICDRVVIINRGQIVANDEMKNLQAVSENSQTVSVEFKETVKLEMLSSKLTNTQVNKESESSFVVESDGTTDLRESIFRFAVDHDLTLLRLEPKTRSLEEVFKNLTKKR